MDIIIFHALSSEINLLQDDTVPLTHVFAWIYKIVSIVHSLPHNFFFSGKSHMHAIFLEKETKHSSNNNLAGWAWQLLAKRRPLMIDIHHHISLIDRSSFHGMAPKNSRRMHGLHGQSMQAFLFYSPKIMNPCLCKQIHSWFKVLMSSSQQKPIQFFKYSKCKKKFKHAHWVSPKYIVDFSIHEQFLGILYKMVMHQLKGQYHLVASWFQKKESENL